MNIFEITCDVGAYSAVKDALAEAKIQTVSAELAMVPQNTVAVPPDKAKQVINLMEALEDHDDVQNAYANFDLPEDALEQHL